MPDGTLLITIGLMLIIMGFFLTAFGTMLSAKKRVPEIKEESVKGGGVILIGPVPVVFGTDKRYVLLLMILAIVLMLLAIILLNT